jgi:hypothetical protein
MGEGFRFVTLLSRKTEVGEQKSDTICQNRNKLLVACFNLYLLWFKSTAKLFGSMGTANGILAQIQN